MTHEPADLLEWLDAVSVMAPGMWMNEASDALPKWCAVVDENDGIIAYFLNATEAFRFRLDYINRKLNP